MCCNIICTKLCVSCGTKKVEEYEAHDKNRGTIRSTLLPCRRGEDLKVVCVALCPACFIVYMGKDKYMMFFGHTVTALVESWDGAHEQVGKREQQFTVNDTEPKKWETFPPW